MSYIKDRIKEHEGFRSFGYLCPAGKLSVGYGRNIDIEGGLGITKDEADFLLSNDIERCLNDLNKFPWFSKLNDVRKDALTEMLYNLGLTRFLSFKNMIRALSLSDFNSAAKELMDSKWARHDVGTMRSLNIKYRLQHGKIPGK